MTQARDETAKSDDVETVLSRTGRSNGDPVETPTFDDPEEEAAFWRAQFERERERLASMVVAYKDVVAELELRKEEAEKNAQQKAVARALAIAKEDASRPSDETVAASTSPTELESEHEATEPPSSPPEPAVEERARASSAEAEEARASEEDPFGHVHPVVDVEGIGEVYTEALEAAGIDDSHHLWAADADEVAQALDISPKVVRRWQAQAELMALDEVGPQYAELLVRSGITSIEELCDEEPEELLEKVERKQDALDVRIQGNVQSERRVRRWIEAAKSHDT